LQINIVDIARAEIGHGEQGDNNKGKYVKEYLRGQEDLPWCAGFVSYCAKKAGYNLRYTLRAKDFLKLGIQVSRPKSGDLIVFSRKGGGHVGIVSGVYGNNIITIEGNLGKYPAKVKECHYELGQIKNLIGFIRLEKK